MSIQIEELSYTYSPGTTFATEAVRGISLEIKKGEFLGLMGHTGCGKTTLIQLIAGLLEPTRGEIRVDGDNINSRQYDRGILRKKIGMVFQHPEYQLFEATVEKDVSFGLKHSGLSKTEIRERVREALQLVGLPYEEIYRESPMALSGGEKRRAAIAGVLAVRPEILIFDEPTAGLDPRGRREFLQLAEKLNQRGATILMISHDADILCEYARRVVVMEQGKIALEGSPREVFSQKELLAELKIGTSQAAMTAELLRQNGFLVSEHIIGYEELVNEIKAVIKRGDGI